MQDSHSERETERMRIVASYEALDTPPEADFDAITRLAADIFSVPIAAIVIVDKDRQWFKSAVGLALSQTERCISFCTHTIESSAPFIISNALMDARFKRNPLVLGEPHIRFYAGVPLITHDGIALGSFCLIDDKPRNLSQDQISLLKSLADHVMSLFELRLQRNKLRRSLSERESISEQLNEYTTHLAEAQRIANIGSWALLLDEDQLRWSEQALRIFGIHDEGAQPSLDSFISYVHPEDRPAMIAAHDSLLHDETGADIEYRIVRPDGELRYVHALAEPKGSEPQQQKIIYGTVQDITERRLAELELQRVNRALKLLTASSEALVRGADEMRLLAEICQFALGIGGYRMAWVGYAQDDAKKSILPMAYAGNSDDADFLAKLQLSWSADVRPGQGPSGRTIRSGLPVICEDISKELEFCWAQEARKRGFYSAICLPLRDQQRTFGLMALYGGEVEAVPAEEIKLLQQMADGLAFGILNIRTREEQKKLQSAVLQVSTSVASRSGKAFFENMAQSMAEVLDAQGSFVAKLLPGSPLRAQTIAAIVDGQPVQDFDYLLEQTPCRNLLYGEDCLVPAAAAELYPDSPSLAALNIEAYVGLRLTNSAGQPIGMLFVLFREPLKQAAFVTSTLRVFATRAAAEMERQEADKRISEQASLLDKAKDAIIVRDLEGHIQFWNKSAERLYGWSAEEVLGCGIESLVKADADFYHEATQKVMTLGEWTGEITEQRKDGSNIVVEGHWTLVRNDKGQPQSILAIKTDITQRKAVENEIQQLAFYDVLTRLPNRQLLLDRLGKSLAHCLRNKQSGALLFIDLDNFKTLNDTLGHDTGDLLLQQVAQRLLDCVRKSDTVGRLGGDEFVVMIDDLNSTTAVAGAKQVGEKILAAFTQPFNLKDCQHHTTPSIGVALFNGEMNDVDALLKSADLAMYQAKASGKNILRFFDPAMQAVVNARANMEARLRQALQLQQLLLHYQPQVDSLDNIIGVEALLRWQHPETGLVSPMDFIPLAEETGLIIPIGEWVLRNACERLALWSKVPSLAQLTLAVNVSARQFRHPDFVSQVLDILAQTGANPHKLKLELTESLVVANIADIIAKMNTLKAAGVGFSLDDFGTGYSSLSYLKRMPLDQLKIDQTFVREVLTDPNDAAIASTIISLARSLGLGVIAEGVETAEQRAFLFRNGCYAYQGYLFSKPLPLEQFEIFVSQKT